MTARLIVNPNAGSADALEWLAEVGTRLSCEICRTRGPDEASRLACDGPRDGFDTIIAAGGDGTVHAVINGMAQNPSSAARLGIIRLGTGNDLARTLAIPDDPLEAVGVIAQERETTIDLMRVRTAGKAIYAANVAAGGFTGQMNEAMTDQIKQNWGPLAYLRGALGVLPDLTSYETCMKINDGPDGVVVAYNLIIANARTAGGGIVVAPRANPEDGLLDLVVVHVGTVAEMVGVGARLLAGDYTQSDMVTHRQIRKIAIHSRPGMWFNVDGELIGNEPIEIEVVPHRLRVLVGEDYQAEM